MRITQGTFSFLPDLTDEEIEAQVRYSLANAWAPMFEYTDDPHPRNNLWEMWKQPEFDLEPDDAEVVMQELHAVREAYPNHYIKLVAYDSSLGRQTSRLSFIVNRPDEEPGYRVERQEANDRHIRYTIHPYAQDDAPGRRYGNQGALGVDRYTNPVQEGTPGPNSPIFGRDGGDQEDAPGAARDEGVGES
jgi:ribulose-bisphosphate carboxylase small chain